MRAFLGLLVTGLMMSTAVGEDGTKDDGSKILTLTMKSLSGEPIDLAQYKGKVILAVNVASRCGYTGQYAGLQELYEKYKEQGLVVMGFPCNQFGGQEPGSPTEIAEFCSSKFGVTFEMFDKVDVNGDGACDLYKYLTSLDTKPAGKGKISWNFEKFLIDRDGQVVARYKSGTGPGDKELVTKIESLLKDG